MPNEVKRLFEFKIMNTRLIIYSHSDKEYAYWDVICDGVKSVEKVSLKSKPKIVDVKGINVQID